MPVLPPVAAAIANTIWYKASAVQPDGHYSHVSEVLSFILSDHNFS